MDNKFMNLPIQYMDVLQKGKVKFCLIMMVKSLNVLPYQFLTMTIH